MAGFRRSVRVLALVALSAGFPGRAAAYHIKHMGAQHEIFTVLAESCLRRLQERVLRENCGWPASTKEFDAVQYDRSAWGAPVRWPDDTMRRAYSFQLFRLAYLELGGCRIQMKQPDFPGLQCESDMGRLQFFHAMRWKDDDDGTTRRRILDWTRFSFDVGTGRVSSGAGLCDAVMPYSALDSALRAANGYCTAADATPGPRVEDFFASHCGHHCRVLDQVDAVTKATAVGAILHLVQDSFSQSHAARGGNFPYGPYTARVVCAPVEAFYTYDEWQAKVHRPGDNTPTFDEGCARSAVIDPITASARLMWLWQNGCDSSWAVELVDKGVLGGLGPARAPNSVEQCRSAA